MSADRLRVTLPTMPPAKRAARSTADPTPEVSSVAAKAATKAAKKAAARKSGGTKAVAKKAVTQKAATQKAVTQKAVASKASPAKATPAKASPTKADRATARKASATAMQAVGETAARVGKAVGSTSSGLADRAEQAATTAEKVVAQAARPVNAGPVSARKAPAKARKAPAKRTSSGNEGVRPTPAERTAGAAEVEAVAAAAATPDSSASPSPSPNGSAPASAGAFGAHEEPSAVRQHGREQRKQLRRQELGAWAARGGRTDPIELINETNVDRLPSLIPLRWTRMLESPFAYLRGAAAVMAYDLADSPTSGLTAQLCGDAHVANFGLYASRERLQVLDVNDFDESLVGPWEFDVKRLATSIVVAARVAGVKEKAYRAAASGAVRVYRQVVNGLAELPVLNAWAASLESELATDFHLDDLKPVLKAVYGKARRNTSVRAVKKMASKQPGGGWRFDTHPPELTRLPESEAAVILAGLEDYADSLPSSRRVLLHRFQPVDVALRVGGVGSIGLRTYAVLLQGNGADDPLVLQVKEARTPTVGRYVGTPEPDRHQGERTVAAQQLMQVASDPLLGWTRIEGRDFFVRQLRYMQGSVDATALKKNQIDDYGRLVGALLARAHCRSLDPRLLAGYLGKGEQVDESMVDFALAYAEQTERDHAALVEAAAEGRVPTI